MLFSIFTIVLNHLIHFFALFSFFWTFLYIFMPFVLFTHFALCCTFFFLISQSAFFPPFLPFFFFFFSPGQFDDSGWPKSPIFAYFWLQKNVLKQFDSFWDQESSYHLKMTIFVAENHQKLSFFGLKRCQRWFLNDFCCFKNMTCIFYIFFCIFWFFLEFFAWMFFVQIVKIA